MLLNVRAIKDGLLSDDLEPPPGADRPTISSACLSSICRQVSVNISVVHYTDQASPKRYENRYEQLSGGKIFEKDQHCPYALHRKRGIVGSTLFNLSLTVEGSGCLMVRFVTASEKQLVSEEKRSEVH